MAVFRLTLELDSVEKKLSTAWIIKLLNEKFNTVDLERMSELKTLDLPGNKSKVKIFLDHNPCS
ncbi:hypothetical protein B0T26DRAFT_705083, partial [Lasiosphaeria miniovina]